jgi:hypothetical protein
MFFGGGWSWLGLPREWRRWARQVSQHGGLFQPSVGNVGKTMSYTTHDCEWFVALINMWWLGDGLWHGFTHINMIVARGGGVSWWLWKSGSILFWRITAPIGHEPPKKWGPLTHGLNLFLGMAETHWTNNSNAYFFKMCKAIPSQWLNISRQRHPTTL